MTDFTEPQSSRVAYTNFVEDGAATYADADDAYETWAAAIGVGGSGTDYVMSTTYNQTDFFELDFSPVDGGTARYVLFAQGGPLMLFDAPPPVLTASFAASFGLSNIFRYTMAPTEKPFLALGAVNTEVDYHITADFKMRQTAEEAIIIWTHRKDTAGTVNAVRVAYRLRSGYIEIVFAPVAGSFSGGNTIKLAYAVGNETLDTNVSSAAIVTGLTTGVYTYKSDDLGVLRPGIFDDLGISETVPPGWVAGATLADMIAHGEAMHPAFGLTLAAGVGLAPVAARTWLPGAVVREVIRQQDAALPNGTYGVSTVEAARLTDLLSTAFPATITQGIGFAPAVTAVSALLVLERLGIVETVGPAAKYGFALLESLLLSDGLSNFFGGELTETIGMGSTLGQLYLTGRAVSEGVGITGTLTPQLVLRVDLDEDIDVTMTQAIGAILRPELSEAFEISAAFVAPDGGVTAWATNTQTNATTEYTNFNFNSFAKIGSKYLAASSDGLYELNGDDDDGDDIVSVIRSGMLQFNSTKLAGIAGAYIAMRGEGEYILRLIAGDGRTYDYGVNTVSGRTTKVKTGKGLRARYFAFELIGRGEDFDLDTLEFVPLWPTRHV